VVFIHVPYLQMHPNLLCYTTSKHDVHTGFIIGLAAGTESRADYTFPPKLS